MPGFEKQDLGNTYAQAPEPADCAAWFEHFADNAISAIGERFHPVCRMSDGEFGFLFGPRYRRPSSNESALAHITHSLEYVKEWGLLASRGVRALTMTGVSSGEYSLAERQSLRARATQGFALVAQMGVLAIHLEYSDHPFNERYYAPLSRWITHLGAPLTLANYAPFSFVYGLLRGPRRRELFHGRNILAVHSATDSKRAAIVRSLMDEGAADVRWMALSSSRSFLDTIPADALRRTNQICLVGAGLGKPNIFLQLQASETLCIDAGYCFEVWADPSRQWHRAYLTPDDTFDWRLARFIDDKRRRRFGLPPPITQRRSH